MAAEMTSPGYEGDETDNTDDAGEPAEPPPRGLPVGEDTLAAMPESELAVLLDMPQYERTQALLEETAADGVASYSNDVSARNKRRRGCADPASDERLRGRAGFSFGELLERVQCSEAELRRALVETRALETPGSRFHAVPDALARDVATAALRSIAAGRMDISAVPMEAVAADLASADGHCAELTAHALQQTLGGRTLPGGGSGRGTEEAAVHLRLCLDFRSLARFVGMGVLQAAGAMLHIAAPAAARALPLAAFLRAWTSAMPAGTVLATGAAPAADRCAGPLDLSLLSGDVLLQEGGSAGPGVLFLPAASLSAITAMRFRQLFSLRAKWRLQDLEPFIAPVANPASPVADLLLTYTRSSQQPDGSRLFSARS